MSDPNTKQVVAFGEVLWDCLPRGLFLGGAPLNVAYHTARLGGKSYVASAIGRDFMGDEARRRIKAAGIGTALLKRHQHLHTGATIASLSESGDASYEILEPVAWDEIEFEPADSEQLATADAFVYGSLASRSQSNRALLEGLLEASGALKVCDVNLREPFDDPVLALQLARWANVLKVNEDELKILGGMDIADIGEALENLNRITGVETICVTRGGEGAAIWREGSLVSAEAKPVQVADTIGAGDSFMAALTMGLLEGRGIEECLDRALSLGAFVASRDGAQPDYDADEVLG